MLEHKVELSRLPPLESGIETTEIDLRLSESCPTGAAMPYRTVILSLVFIASWAAAMSQTTATEHTLKPTPKMVAWGYYDAKAAPVLRVKSGDTVPSLSSASSVNSAFSALGLFRVISPDLALPSPRTEKPEWCKPLPRPEYKSLQRVLQDDPWFEVYKAVRAAPVRRGHFLSHRRPQAGPAFRHGDGHQQHSQSYGQVDVATCGSS